MNEIKINAVYLKESSIELPNAPDIFFESFKDTVTDLNCRSSFLKLNENDDMYEVNLNIEICARQKRHAKETGLEQSLYILNFTYAGLFELNNFKDEEEIEEALAVDCPNIIFPYARQYVSFVTGLTTLPTSLIQEINFKELYYKEIGKEYK